MIIARNIFKSYGHVHVLKGVNLEVNEGEIVSIVGASGAGKTTLLQILGTLESADRGELIFNGKDLSGWKEKKLAAFRNASIGFVFQFHHLLPEFTALENVCMPGLIAGKSLRQLEADAMNYLDFFGLKERAAHRPGEMSGGEQQRVAMARALINNPRLVLADEPTGNLDSVNSREIHKLILRCREEFHQSFVITTHNPELAALADRQLVMKDGLLNK